VGARSRPANEKTGRCRWLIAAVALHASLLLLARTGVEPTAVPKVRFSEPPSGEAEVELDLDASTPRSRDSATRRSPRSAQSPLEDPAAPRVSRAELFALPAEAAEPVGTAEPVEAVDAEPSAVPDDDHVAAPNATTPEPNAPNTPIDLGIGADAWQRWLPRSAESVAVSERAETPKSGRYQPFRAPPVSTTGGVQEGLEARTRALGLGPSGRVISAFHQAARAADAPQIGKASFQVTVTQAGAVEIALASSTAPIAGWQAVAAKAAAEIRRALPRIPRGRAGVRLVVDLVAEEVMPSGLRTKELHGPRLEVAPPRFRSSESQKAELEARNPTAGTDSVPLSETKANVEIPGIYVAGRGKVCGYRLGVTPLGPLLQGGCDFANAGSKPQRIVRATTHDEVLF
jgi:hypothetical protein